jgi:hypothetical protein
LKYFFILLFLIVKTGLLSAQDPYYIKIDKTKGLPSNAIYGIFQDSKGFIWITSQVGLTRYDGYEFKTYTCPQQTSKPGSFIQEDNYGRIWYQNFDGYVYYVENDTMKMLHQNPPVAVLHFAVINNQLYKLQKNGVDVFDLKTLLLIKTITVDNQMNYRSVNSKNIFYIMNKYFFYKIDSANNLSPLPYPQSLIQNKPINLYPAKNEIALLARENTFKALYELEDDTFKYRFPLKEIDYIHNFSYTDSSYWFFTPKGVFAYNNTRSSINNNQAFFTNKSVGCVLKDREGNLWFGSATDGILLVPNINCRILTDEIKPYRLFLNGKDLYTGTQNAAIYKTDLTSKHTSMFYKDSWYSSIYNQEYDNEQKTLTFSSDKFKIIKNNKIIFQAGAIIKYFEKLNDKYYAFASTGSYGLIKIKNTNQKTEWDKIFNKYLLDYDPGQAHLVDGIRGKSLTYNSYSNTIYCTTNSGLFKATPDTVYEIKMNRKSIYSNKIYSYKDDVYTLTSNGLLLKIDRKDSIENLSKATDIESEHIDNIKVFDNFLFLITSDQLMYMDLNDGKNKVNKPGIFIQQIKDIVLWQNKLVISTNEALLLQDFSLQSQASLPQLIINSFTVNNIPFTTSAANELSYNQNNIEIKYSILYFKNDFKFPLYYKINNNDWELAPAESRILKLSSLSPENYTVSFRLGDKYQNNNSIQTIQFNIKNPWWKQWWFVTIYILAILGVAFAYYKYQTKKLIKRNELLAEKNELEKSLNNSILTSIKAQMNPHFFYNALNAIQSFIITNDKKSATAYLSKFSKLTRMVLEMSEKKYVSLNDELVVLSIYVEIEKLRFDNNLTFNLNIANDLNINFIKIPSMIIQPYVENAIRHGLLHKKGERTLTITFEKKDGNLQIIIDDNGIGRKQSAEINKIKKEKYQSFSTKANQTRIELLNKGSNNKMGVEFIDKVDEENNATGTTVIITIALN